MANLFWRRKAGATLNLLSVPFKSEEEFERAVFETKGLLEDVYLLRRQVRGGRKPGIPDIVGVDSDGNVCIVEMKNVPVDAAILPQVLQYAFWAESNPDSIKALWLEAPEQPEDVGISFEQYEVRIIVIAPSIDPSTLALVGKINYPVDLVEVKRWIEDSNEFLLVNRLEPEIPAKVRPTHGLPVYDREFYEAHYNKASVQHFLSYVEQTTAFVQKSGWPLEPKFNKHYCGFNHGFFNAFGIKWIGSKSFAFFFKLSEDVARSLSPKGTEMMRYEDQWKEAVFRVEPGETTIESFASLFRAAVETLTGKK
ncbi:MAG: hypothetical protein KGL31_09865 [candidate division NC10 bacterium]|nr:hypothetical protein [candidate division NC10 bacterium]MDE2322203.1 hypothetical protein [candidate division NC10 bacterium]